MVNPATLLGEIEKLAALGIEISRIKISDRAHVVLPHHVDADRAAEDARGAGAIGTTGGGIGPAYVDKVAPHVRPAVRHVDAREGGDENRPRRLAPHVVDGVGYVHEKLAAGKRVLIEGAQGSLLDVGYGTYPYVTSSHTIAGGACIGLGIGPTSIGRVTGVVKAYCTRVGGGPFPSELHDERGERLRRQGAEFGTVTGRPRRCGWFDAVAGRYAVAINGLTGAAMTKLDVLTGFSTLGIVTGYRRNGKSVGFSAIGESSFDDKGDAKLELEVEELPGWSEPIEDCRRIEDLPPAARRYVARVEELLATPIELVSVGRERTQLAR